MVINLNWINVLIALAACFTPFGIAQIQIYSDVQSIKDKQEILFDYKQDSQLTKDEAMKALQMIMIDLQYIKLEAKTQKEYREQQQKLSADFFYLNPTLNKPR